MGNRAVLTFSTSRTTGVGIYVHWNGGPSSVLAFLEVAKRRGYRDPSADPVYAMARLCGLICEFFGGPDSVGVGVLKDLDCDNWDNGVYVIGEGWRVVERWGKGSEPMLTLDQLDKPFREAYDGIVEKLMRPIERETACSA